MSEVFSFGRRLLIYRAPKNPRVRARMLSTKVQERNPGYFVLTIAHRHGGPLALRGLVNFLHV